MATLPCTIDSLGKFKVSTDLLAWLTTLSMVLICSCSSVVKQCNSVMLYGWVDNPKSGVAYTYGYRLRAITFYVLTANLRETRMDPSVLLQPRILYLF